VNAEPVSENVGRLKSNLRRHPAAMAALRAMQLNGATIDRLHLGLKAPYRSRADGAETRDALCFPVVDAAMRPIGRYAYMNLPGITGGAQSATTWGPGTPLVYRLGSDAPSAVAVVAADVVDAWLAWQISRGQTPDMAFVSRSHAGGWPAEWKSPEFWSCFSRVLLLPGVGETEFLRDIAPKMERPLERVRLPSPLSSMSSAASQKPPLSLDELLGEPEAWTQAMPRAVASVPADGLGRFAAAPIAITGAFSGGHLYYPVSVERRDVEMTGRGAGRVVHSYETMVIRSDGHFLSSELLPAPRGTPMDQRVLALSDGTRIIAEPVASRFTTWSLSSIEAFAHWRTKGGKKPFRTGKELAGEVEAVIRARTWLPEAAAYRLAAYYVMLSHVAQVFDVMPLFVIAGETRSGRGTLAESMARLGFNSTVAGQLRAPGMMRLLDESRGLLVLDSPFFEDSASGSGAYEVAQALRSSFKRSTSTKPVADRGGKVRLVDFFGPKVVITSSAPPAVSGWRTVCVRAQAYPDGATLGENRFDEANLDGLRDELHAWGMASASELSQAYQVIRTKRAGRFDDVWGPFLTLATILGEDVLERLEWDISAPSTVA
jgi:hypothetical protein